MRRNEKGLSLRIAPHWLGNISSNVLGEYIVANV